MAMEPSCTSTRTAPLSRRSVTRKGVTAWRMALVANSLTTSTMASAWAVSSDQSVLASIVKRRASPALSGTDGKSWLRAGAFTNPATYRPARTNRDHPCPLLDGLFECRPAELQRVAGGNGGEDRCDQARDARREGEAEDEACRDPLGQAERAGHQFADGMLHA